MSVIAQLAGDLRLHVYMKGAPEMVARFCSSETGTDVLLFGWLVFSSFKRGNPSKGRT